MKRGLVVIAGLASSLLWQASTAYAIESSNPYSSIAARNAFALKPIPPPKDPSLAAAEKAAAEAEPPPKVELTCIAVLSNQKKAYFNVTPTKPPNSKVEHVSLREGQKAHELEVLEIREKLGEVRVVCQGKELTLDIRKNGGKLESVTSSGQPGVVPGVPGAPGSPGIPSGPGAVTMPNGRPGFQGRIPPPAGFNQGGIQPPVGAPQNEQEIQSFGAPVVQPLNTPFQSGAVNPANAPGAGGQATAVSFEQAIQNLEANARANADAVAAGKSPPYPPTSASEVRH